MSDRFAFDATTHTYTIDGARVPSVTQVLKVVNDYSGIPPAVLENARDRGEKLHKAIALHSRGILDVSSIDAETLDGVSAWEDFLGATGAVVIESEQQVFHAGLRYAGTLDLVLLWDDKYVLPDLKASFEPPPTVPAQTAAYERAWREKNQGRKARRCCIHIRKGKYNVLPHDDAADWNLFVSALNCWKFINDSKHR